MITFSTPAKFLEAIAKPYNFQGNEGISYKVRLLVEDQIFQLKSNKDQIENFKQYEGEDGEATFIVTANREEVKLVLAQFNTD